MKRCLFAMLAAALLLVGALQAQATVIFSDGFETYNVGQQLDFQGPWQPDYPNGNSPDDLYPLTSVGGMTPHSGNVFAATPSAPYQSANYVNLPFHVTNGSNLLGDFVVDWWFYDPNGAANGGNYRDNFCLTSWSGLPTDSELNQKAVSTLGWAQRIQVGAATPTTGMDATKYQVRIFGASGYGTSGWFNTTLDRSLGWHEGKIVVGTRLGDGTNMVDIFIDSTQVAHQIAGTSPAAGQPHIGYNAIEMVTAYGTAHGGFDDISINTVPEPSAFLALGTGLLGLLGVIRRRK